HPVSSSPPRLFLYVPGDLFPARLSPYQNHLPLDLRVLHLRRPQQSSQSPATAPSPSPGTTTCTSTFPAGLLRMIPCSRSRHACAYSLYRAPISFPPARTTSTLRLPAAPSNSSNRSP